MRYILKLFIAIVLGYFIFFGVVGPSIYSKAVESLREEIMRHLITVRELKKLELEEYFFERRGDLSVLAKDPLVIDSLPGFINAFKDKGLGSKQYIDVEKDFGAKLTYYTKTYGYEDLFLADVDGNVVFAAVDESYLGINLMEVDFIDPMIPDIFMEGRSKVAFSDFVWFELFNELTAFGAAPIRDRRGDVMGVLIFQLAFGQINGMMEKKPGLGKTGESYLVGEDKLMRSNSRFVEGETAYQLRVDTEAVRESMKGHAGVGIIDDYRGEPVLSAYAPLNIEHFNWCVIAEIDVKEAFGPIKSLRNFMYVIAGLLVAGVSIYGYIAYRKEMKLVEEDEEYEEDEEDEEDEVVEEKKETRKEKRERKKKEKKEKKDKEKEAVEEETDEDESGEEETEDESVEEEETEETDEDESVNEESDKEGESGEDEGTEEPGKDTK